MIFSELQKRILSSLILIPVSFFFIIQGSIFFTFFLSFIFFVTSYEWIKMSKKKELIKIFGIIFLFFSLSTAYFIRENYSLNFILLIITVCIFTDIGGYVFGKVFKGPKLSKISPNKTYSGVFGSFLISLIAALIYINYFGKKYLLEIDQAWIVLLILFVSLISQVGDLIISYFKRKAKLKDTGKIIPGHGGLLDRIDGLIFVFPTLFIVNLILN
tara:strand:- start:1649 stop:2293 length:645 start_codon:yes stop_codon:yes gene_type:complete